MPSIYDDAQKNASSLKGRQKEIADGILSCYDESGIVKRNPNDGSSMEGALRIDMKKLLGWTENSKLSDIFRPGSDETAALTALVGKKNADFAIKVWNRTTDYPYGEKIRTWRSSKRFDIHIPTGQYRTKKFQSFYCDAAVVEFIKLVGGLLDGFDMKTWLATDVMENGFRFSRDPNDGLSPFRYRPSSRALACWMDDMPGGDDVLERIKAILADDTGTKQVSWPLLAILYSSRRPEAYQLGANLLLGAGLMESLRLSAVQAAYEGAWDAFLHVFKTIVDNNLCRYTSVTKQIADWLNIGFDKPASPQARQCAEDAYRCLTDAAFRQQCIAGDNPLTLYVGLWAQALTEVADVFAPLQEIVEKGPRQRKIAALYMLNQLGMQDANIRAAMTIFKDDGDRKDTPLMALTLTALSWTNWIAWQKKPAKNLQPEDPNTPHLTLDEHRRLYEGLKAAANDFVRAGTKEYRADVDLGNKTTVSYSLETVLTKMIDLARRPAPEGEPSNLGYYRSMEENEFYSHWLASDKTQTRLNGMPASKMRGLPFVADALDKPFPDGWNLRDDLCGLMDLMNGSQRRAMVHAVIRDGSGSPTQRAALVGMFGDRTTGRKWTGAGSAETATVYTSGLELTEPEYETIESNLTSKDGALRQTIFKKLLDRPAEGLDRSVKRLLAAKDKNMREAGSELLHLLSQKTADPEYAAAYQGCQTAPEKPAAKLAAKTTTKKSTAQPPVEAAPPPAQPTPLPGPTMPMPHAKHPAVPSLGLFDPAGERASFTIPDVPKIKTTKDAEKLFALSKDALARFYASVDEFVDRHADHEYQYRAWNGAIETHVLGDNSLRKEYRPDAPPPTPGNRAALTLDAYPFANEWRRLVKESGLTPATIMVYNMLPRFPDDLFPGDRKWGADSQHPAWIPEQPLSRYMLSVKNDMVRSRTGADKDFDDAYRRKYIAHTVVYTAEQDIPLPDRYRILRQICLAMLEMNVPNKADPFVFFADWFEPLERTAFACDDAVFADWFKLIYQYGYGPNGFDWPGQAFRARDLARAFRLGLLPENDFIRTLLFMGTGNLALPALTSHNPGRQLAADAPGLAPLLARIADRLVEVETPRGDMPTEASTLAGKVVSFEGAARFVDILAHMRDIPFERAVLRRPTPVRDDIYGWRIETDTKKKMLSHLLRSCYPAPSDDATTLKALAKKAGLTDQRLVDGAMFAPQWLTLTEQCLGWPGLESMGWFFHAHVAEALSPETATKTAEYTDMPAEDLNAGACDASWFNEAYAALGPKRYATVFNASKYIANGANHRRAQLFAEAMSGALKPESVAKEILDKRNQNNALCYGLIPWDKKDPQADQLKRYLTLQEFNRTRAKVGAQRRATEERIAATALETMAKTAGYDSATRFSWKMETALAASRDLYGRHELDSDVTVWLESAPDGGLSAKVEKNGKPLKSIPAAQKRNPVWLDLKETEKSWKEQQSRTRQALEEAMIHAEPFDMADLAALSTNPAFKSLLGRVLFKAGNKIDFPEQLLKTKAKGPAVVAHPVHLLEAGNWEAWQRTLFDQKLVQPFKQVFRELYVPTKDELARKTVSERYANCQINPTRGNGVMKSRGWVPEYEGGYRRIFRRENLSVRVSLTGGGGVISGEEYVQVGDIMFSPWRGGGRVVDLKDVPPVLYSEVMRDVDLLVSVAFAGGAVPEASQSTVEMRIALIREAARLFKLDNVTFKKMHALIKGKRGVYTVHLGSGVVHKQARGAVAVMAVPSQQRGAVFLPFLDDDPRTAEILTKVLLFARDGEIKDPAILQQL